MSENPKASTTLLTTHLKNNGSYNSLNYQNELNNSDLIADGNDESDISDIGNGFPLRQLKFCLIEPTIFILIFSYNFSSTIMKNRIIFQTCTSIFLYNISDCNLLGTNNPSESIKEIEANIQPYVTNLLMISTQFECAMSVIAGMFIGSFADRFGRKPLLIIGFLGYALYYTFSALISYLASFTLISPWYYLCANLPHILFGGSVTYTVAAYCYLSDVTTEQDRPYRMTYFEAAINLGLMSGALSSGFIYEMTNSTIIFAISAMLIYIAIIVIKICIPESLHLRVLPQIHRNHIRPFNLQSFKQTICVCFQVREYKDRAIILLSISALLLSEFVISGSNSVFYLFTRQKFHLTIKDFTLFDTISILLPLLGNIFGMWLLRKLMKFSVIELGIFAIVSHICSSFLKFFAANVFDLYLTVLIGALKSIESPMFRTIIMNIVPSNELGKLFTFNGVLVSFIPIISTFTYTRLYNSTLTTYPGLFNILSGNLYLISIALILIILKKSRQHPTHYESLLN